MALYAFDGTWNKPDLDENSDDRNTNVIKFAEYYAQIKNAGADLAKMKADYIHGVGNRFGRTGHIVGGFVGAGGKDRVREMVEIVKKNFEAGDEEVDVIGFSRGAAIAVHFCNKLDKGIEVRGKTVRPMVRFLGLWDIVPAFGAPGIFVGFASEINFGWDLDLPENVLRCAHAMALNETRQAFNVLRLDSKGKYPHVRERWFRGVHSDVGGGNGNLGLQSIALHWMMEQAREKDGSGVPVIPFSDEQLAQVLARANDKAVVSVNGFGGKTENRPFHLNDEDKLHPSAAKRLRPNESVEVEVNSELVFNYSGILADANASYTFTPDPAGRWTDLDIDCDASGWPDAPNDDDGFLAKLGKEFLKSRVGGLLRRVRRASWFELCACPGFDDDDAFPIGSGQFATTPWKSPRVAPLTFFANDCLLPNKYDNNRGSIKVRVTRIS